MAVAMGRLCIAYAMKALPFRAGFAAGQMFSLVISVAVYNNAALLSFTLAAVVFLMTVSAEPRRDF